MKKRKDWKKINSLSDVWYNIESSNIFRSWVLEGEKSGDIKRKHLKKQRLKGMLHIKTQLSAAFKKYFKYKDKNGLKVKGWEKIHHANTSQNYGGYINKVNFKANNIIREKRSFPKQKGEFIRRMYMSIYLITEPQNIRSKQQNLREKQTSPQLSSEISTLLSQKLIEQVDRKKSMKNLEDFNNTINQFTNWHLYSTSPNNN